jgi:CHAT domain-containing protein
MLTNADRALIVAAPASSNIQPPPGAMSEADRIAEKFSNATLLWGGKATLSNVRNEIPQNSIFHYAGHATSGRAGAAMVLADGSLAVAANNVAHNKVFDPLREGQRLTHLKLAVFSACATAYPGEMSRSTSLVTEFLQAGTPVVIASHWNVDSEATTDFMELFYQSALSGRNIAGALQNAATKFRATPGRQHPYYWAAFSVFGSA